MSRCTVLWLITLPCLRSRRDAPIAVPAFVPVVNRLDLVIGGSVLVCDLHGGLLVVKGASRQACGAEKRRERMLRP